LPLRVSDHESGHRIGVSFLVNQYTSLPRHPNEISNEFCAIHVMQREEEKIEEREKRGGREGNSEKC
jgi:hypothetical protein